MEERVEDVLKSKYPEMPDDQLSFVVGVLNNKLGKAWGIIDSNIESVTGKKKPAGKQTGEWLAEELSSYKTKSETIEQMLKGDIEAQRAKNAELEKLIKEGKIDGAAKGRIEELEKALNDERGKLKSLETQRNKDKEDWQKSIDTEKANNHKYRVESLFDSAIALITRKDEKLISKTLQDIAIKEAKERGFSQKGEFVKDPITGKESFVFRDDNNAILMSKDSPGQPMGALEFLRLNGLSEIEDGGRKQNGAGTHTPQGQGGGTGAKVDFGGVKSKTEATDRFNNHWMKVLGKPMTDPNYNKEYQEAFKELPSDLPFA